MDERTTVTIDPVDQNVVNRIAKGSRVVGEYESVGGILIQGHVDGSPLTVRDGPLILLEGGVLTGDATVHGDVFLFGRAGAADTDGGGLNLKVHGSLHIAATAKTYGTIACKQLHTYAGCLVNSAITTLSEGQSGVKIGIG